MKRIKVSVILISILCLAAGNAAAVSVSNISKMRLGNGAMFDLNEDVAEGFTLGVINALAYTKTNEINKFYSNASVEEVLNAVKMYYFRNPLQKDRPIVEVILSGCK